MNTQLVLFKTLIGAYRVPLFRARVDQRAVSIKGYSAFLKAPESQETHIQIV